jgi:hypothetical protein
MEVQGGKYSSYSFSTSALHGGVWSASRPGRVLAPRKRPPLYSLYRRLGGPQSRSGHRGLRKNPFASARDRTSIAWSSRPKPDIVLTELAGSPIYVDTRPKINLCLISGFENGICGQTVYKTRTLNHPYKTCQ